MNKLNSMSAEIMVQIANCLPYKADVTNFEEASKAHKNFTGDYWKKQMEIEGLGIFENDPSKNPKEQYLYAKAVLKFSLKLLSTEELSYEKSCELYRELKPLKAAFPDLYALFRYVLYKKEENSDSNPFTSKTEKTRRRIDSAYRKGFAGGIILHGLLNPEMLLPCLEEAAKRKPIINLMAMQLPNYSQEQLYNLATSAADRGDYRAVDSLLKSANGRQVLARLQEDKKTYPGVLLKQNSNDDQILEAYGPLVPYEALKTIALHKERLLKPEEAESLLTQAMGNYPAKKTPADLFHLANFKVQLKKWDEADSLLAKVNSFPPNSLNPALSSEFLKTIVLVKKKLKKWDEAEPFHDKIIAACEQKKMSWLDELKYSQAAIVKMKLEKFDEADTLFTKAFKCAEDKHADSLKPKIVAHAAYVKSKLGDEAAAKRLYAQALKKLETNSPAGHPRLANRIKAELNKLHEENTLHI